MLFLVESPPSFLIFNINHFIYLIDVVLNMSSFEFRELLYEIKKTNPNQYKYNFC